MCRWLGLDAEESIPEACKNAFDVLCHRMEQRLTYAPNEQVCYCELGVKEFTAQDSRFKLYLGVLIGL